MRPMQPLVAAGADARLHAPLKDQFTCGLRRMLTPRIRLGYLCGSPWAVFLHTAGMPLAIDEVILPLQQDVQTTITEPSTPSSAIALTRCRIRHHRRG